MTDSPSSPPSRRLVSLDALRGFTIAAMVIVNDPGLLGPCVCPAEACGMERDHHYRSHLSLLPFHRGCIHYSGLLKKDRSRGSDADHLQEDHFQGREYLFTGLFLWLFPEFDLSNIRWAGVLQRISVVFLACAILFLNTSWKQQVRIGAVILVLYWIIVAYMPIPGIGRPDLSVPEKNWANYLDTLLLPGVMWQKTWDPEGIFSTFPAIVSGITGMLIGKLVPDRER
jgi:predicted acyltransferase